MSLSVFLSYFFAAGRIIWYPFYVKMPGNDQETQVISDREMTYAYREQAERVRSFNMRMMYVQGE